MAIFLHLSNLKKNEQQVLNGRFHGNMDDEEDDDDDDDDGHPSWMFLWSHKHIDLFSSNGDQINPQTRSLALTKRAESRERSTCSAS